VTAEKIQEILQQQLADCVAVVENPERDGVHFQARVMSPLFVGKTRVQQHQLVYGALGDLMHEAIHALALRTFTPDQWEG